MTTPMADSSTLISVHLVATYPVYWSKFAVLRDFVQNFFDSAGPAKFGTRVRMEGTDDVLMIATRDTGFELDWLTHIGASTKTTASPGSMAGYFGEGFKIAALCAVRDYRWTVAMGSQHWSAAVELAEEQIGQTTVRVLTYRVFGSNPRPGETWVQLGGLSKTDHALAAEVRLCFDFKGNPIVGELLCVSSPVTVSRATERRLHREVPFVGRTAAPGTLFLAHQARATLPFPLVISVRNIRTPERDRPVLYDFQVIEYLAAAARGVSPEVAVEILGYLRAHWTNPLPRQFKLSSWAQVVNPLIHQIQKSPRAKAAFRKQWPDLYVRNAIPRTMISDRNRQSAAMAWLRVYVPRFTLVQPEFLRLGYPTVEAACAAADGFPRPAPQDGVHEKRIELLESFVENRLAPLLSAADVPEIEVLDLRRSGWAGIAEVIPCDELRYSATGRRLRRRVRTISLSADALSATSPARALATFIHERCHAFGGDESAGFSAALTDALQLLVAEGEALAAFGAAWSDVAKVDVACDAHAADSSPV